MDKLPEILAVWKPKGPTSNDVVQEIKKITGGEKVGHAGTLDPLAEGVLVIGIGREGTKNLNIEVKKEKEYIADVKFGTESTTDDEEGEKKVFNVKTVPTLKDVEAVLPKFTGNIKQIPPIYSAIKIGGREAYKFARNGEKPVLLERNAEVKKIEILNYEWPRLELRVVTGPGVYIRALARDIGKELKTGAYLAGLKRTRVGDFTEEKAVSIEQFRENYKCKIK